MALTPKRQAFVDAYTGNGVEACRKAGFKGDERTLAVTASRLLRVAEVAAALKARNQQPTARRIASREERQNFWTEVMLDTGQKMPDRLKAAELLGRSEADFVERVQHSGSLTLAQLIEQATASPVPEETAAEKPVDLQPEDPLTSTQPPEDA